MALIFVHEGYNTGLFDCHDDHQSCFSTMFCAPCAVRAQFQILKDQPSGKFRWICLPFQFVGLVVYGVFMPLWSAITRDMVRRKFHLAQESMLVSAAKGFFCAPCSVGQVYREMSLRHMWPADGSLCVDAPYTKAGLVVPPPNPDRMGGTWASSRATGNNDHQEMRSAPQFQWHQHNSSHQGREEQSAFTSSSGEGAAVVVGQPIAYGYPIQQPTAPPPVPTTTDQRSDHQQHYPTKPVYGYGDGQGQQLQATAPPTASHTTSRPSLTAPAERFEQLQLPSHNTLLIH